MSHLFHGVYEQTHVAHVMAYAACIGPYADKCYVPKNHPVPAPRPVTPSPAQGNGNNAHSNSNPKLAIILLTIILININ